MTLAGLRVDLEFLVREGEDDWGNLSAWTGTTPAIIQMKLSGWKKNNAGKLLYFSSFFWRNISTDNGCQAEQGVVDNSGLKDSELASLRSVICLVYFLQPEVFFPA